ncbi:PAS domain S-box protein (plasmid) [Haloarcula sp. NS06]|uniref:PAS domain-containing protein n=1 Tax=Haloarcula sp. NS06 TaxID=3409688 RepID=UPI003DA750DF
MSETADTIHVLHVDDDPDLADLTAAFLERENDQLDVQTATSPSEGLDVLADMKPDCIVSDYDMPQQNGIELLKAVRQEYPDLPFILYTGKGSEEVASEAISAGVTDYLQKDSGPSQYAVLANRIRNAVRQYHSQQIIEQTERKLSQIAGKSEDVLFLVNADWSEFLFVSSSYEDIWGESIAELKANPESFLEKIHPDDRENVRRSMDCLMDGKPAELEYRVRGADGDYFWVRGPSKPIFDEDGTVARIVGFARDISEQKEHEQELQRVQTRMEFALDATDAVVWSWNVDTDETEFYPSAENLFGSEVDTREEFLEIVHPEDRQRVQDILELMLETGELKQEEFRIFRDGEVRWIAAPGQPVLDDDGPNRVLGVSRDITERKEREQRFTQATARLEVLFEESPDMINIHDTEGNIIDPNPLLCEETGYDEDELTDMKVWELDQELDPEAARTQWDNMEYGDRRRFQGVYQRRDGSEFPVAVHVRRLSVSGEDQFIVISRDVTKRKRYEQQLQRERNLFRAVFEENFDTMILTDDDRQFLKVNQSASELFGLSEKSLVGRTVEEFTPADFDFEEAWREFQHSNKNRGTFPIVRPNGEERIVEYAVTRDVIPGQHLAVLRDVTEREQRQRRLHRQNERLEDFASVVSHDLRNPLSVAEGNLELAQKECDSKHLENVDRALGRMGALIGDLLTLAREGEAVSDLDPVDLRAIVKNCWANVETTDSTLVIDIEKPIFADESRLKQVVENLVRNAVKHGGDDVTVTVGELDDGFYVEDDGSGIPETKLDTVFDAGYSTSNDGTGFGLSIVKQVVSAHNWDIHLTESSSGGVRFEITGVEFVAE